MSEVKIVQNEIENEIEIRDLQKRTRLLCVSWAKKKVTHSEGKTDREGEIEWERDACKRQQIGAIFVARFTFFFLFFVATDLVVGKYQRVVSATKCC